MVSEALTLTNRMRFGVMLAFTHTRHHANDMAHKHSSVHKVVLNTLG